MLSITSILLLCADLEEKIEHLQQDTEKHLRKISELTNENRFKETEYNKLKIVCDKFKQKNILAGHGHGSQMQGMSMGMGIGAIRTASEKMGFQNVGMASRTSVRQSPAPLRTIGIRAMLICWCVILPGHS